MSLTKRAVMWSAKGPVYRTDFPIVHEVEGMSSGQACITILRATDYGFSWQACLVEGGEIKERFSEYQSAEEAFTALEAHINRSVN